MTSLGRKARRAAMFLAVASDAWRAGRDSQAGIARRQLDRLNELVAFASSNSVYFADLYRDVQSPLTDVRQVPAVTKSEMMSQFDDWVTDRQVNRHDAESFLSDPELVGHGYLDRYVACITSGATGTPAIFLHDMNALTVHYALGYVRSLPVAFSLPRIRALFRGRGRLAAVFVTGGHFLGAASSFNANRRCSPCAFPWRNTVKSRRFGTRYESDWPITCPRRVLQM